MSDETSSKKPKLDKIVYQFDDEEILQWKKLCTCKICRTIIPSEAYICESNSPFCKHCSYLITKCCANCVSFKLIRSQMTEFVIKKMFIEETWRFCKLKCQMRFQVKDLEIHEMICLQGLTDKYQLKCFMNFTSQKCNFSSRNFLGLAEHLERGNCCQLQKCPEMKYKPLPKLLEQKVTFSSIINDYENKSIFMEKEYNIWYKPQVLISNITICSGIAGLFVYRGSNGIWQIYVRILASEIIATFWTIKINIFNSKLKNVEQIEFKTSPIASNEDISDPKTAKKILQISDEEIIKFKIPENKQICEYRIEISVDQMLENKARIFQYIDLPKFKDF